MPDILPLPNLIIGGVHKAGTTSVFAYLSQHPDVCASRKKELGFFMPARYQKPYPPMEVYANNFNHYKNEKYILEATPSYLYGKENIADAILHHLGKVKVIFILREPIERLYSFYQFSINQFRTERKISFDEFISQCHTYANGGISKSEEDDHFKQGIIEGFYIDFLQSWHERFDKNLKVLFFDDLQTDTSTFMKDLCQWLNLDFGFYKPSDFTIENRTTFYKNEFIHRIAVQINWKTEKFWRRNHNLKKKLRNVYYSFMEKKQESGISSDSIEKLEKIYKPYNTELKKYLRHIGYNNLPLWLNR